MRRFNVPDETIESVLETALNYVIFTDSHVYKIKKPITIEGIYDYSTLEARFTATLLERDIAMLVCARLLPSVCSVAANFPGEMIRGGGQATDYALQITRLPGGNELLVRLRDNRIASGI